jgi:hypothetical protein
MATFLGTWDLFGTITLQFPQLAGAQALSSPMPYMKDADFPRRGRSLLNRIVHPVFAVPLSIQQNMHFLREIFGFVRNRAAVGQVCQRSNGRNDAIEPLFGLIEASLLLDVPCNFVQVGESLR